MATTLLMQGAGGEAPPNLPEGEEKNSLPFMKGEIQRGSDFESDEFDKFDDDKSPFTREERKQIRVSINNAYDESRQNQERTIDILNERAFNNDEKAINELKVRRTLRDVIKVERPKNHYRTHSNC